jgi:outer membrane receptor for monomeric catechols
LQNGDFQFNGSYTGDALADFLLGDMYQFNTSRPQQDAFRQSIPALYFQDTIHVSNRLTVNAGVRWEPMLFPYDYFARGSSFNMAAFLAGQHSKIFPNAPAGMFYYGDPGIPKGYSNSKWTDFGPRIGLVFNPHADGRDTLRIGAGLLYDTTEMYYTNHLTSNPPFANEIDQTSPSSPATFT